MAVISILIDDPTSWFLPYGAELARRLRERKHDVYELANPNDIPEGEIAFFLSCQSLIEKRIRDRNKCNLVVHASALPHGKGWSPVTWQILDGVNEIPLTIFEAVDKVDAGDIYGQSSFSLTGHELIDEIRSKEGEAIIALILKYVDAYPAVQGIPQVGNESFYPRRYPKDSQLNPHQSLVAQFDKLRVVDNERYPAFFLHLGHEYVLKIYKRS